MSSSSDVEKNDYRIIYFSRNIRVYNLIVINCGDRNSFFLILGEIFCCDVLLRFYIVFLFVLERRMYLFLIVKGVVLGIRRDSLEGMGLEVLVIVCRLCLCVGVVGGWF